MSFCVIDTKKCVTCGACSAVCPVGIITKNKDTKIPMSILEREEFCIRCGHCVSVCPTAAFSLSAFADEKMRELKAGWNLAADAVDNFLRGRRSIRTYKRDPVSKDSIEKIIDTARYAPSGINRQPVHWTVVYEPEAIKRICEEVINWTRNLIAQGNPMAETLRFEAMVKAWENGRDVICRGAPHLALLYGLKDDMTAPSACVIAATYFELAIAAGGLGSCWAGYVEMAINMYEPARKVAGIPEKAACFAAVMFGYPAYAYHRIPPRNPVRITWR